jgi:hypothetical protein
MPCCQPSRYLKEQHGQLQQACGATGKWKQRRNESSARCARLPTPQSTPHRFLAATMVLLFHLATLFWCEAPTLPLPQPGSMMHAPTRQGAAPAGALARVVLTASVVGWLGATPTRLPHQGSVLVLLTRVCPAAGRAAMLPPRGSAAPRY